MGAKNEIITAASAKNLVKSSKRPLNTILRRIKESAEDGKHCLVYFIEDMEEDVAKSIEKQLIDLGFKTELILSENIYEVDEDHNYSSEQVTLIIEW